jgi:hypothetical protein
MGRLTRPKHWMDFAPFPMAHTPLKMTIPGAQREVDHVCRTAALHTWGQTLVQHPHLHLVVPGGGLTPDASRWVAARPRFFLPVRVLRCATA